MLGSLVRRLGGGGAGREVFEKEELKAGLWILMGGWHRLLVLVLFLLLFRRLLWKLGFEGGVVMVGLRS